MNSFKVRALSALVVGMIIFGVTIVTSRARVQTPDDLKENAI